MPQDLTNEKSTLVQVMAWCLQATSYYLNQCCPRSPTPYGVTRPQWVNRRGPYACSAHISMHNKHIELVKVYRKRFWTVEVKLMTVELFSADPGSSRSGLIRWHLGHQNLAHMAAQLLLLDKSRAFFFLTNWPLGDVAVSNFRSMISKHM